MNWLEQLTQWHWFIFGLGLLILEIFAPGAFFLWMGVSAGVVGVILWIVPSMSWEAQFVIFSVLSIVSIVYWRQRMKKKPLVTDQPALNRRGQQYVGRTFTLAEPIVNRVGKIKVDDSIWKIEGEDCEAGTQVVVKDVDGTILVVEHK